MSKERLDALVVQQGLAESREQARRLILAGAVRLAGQVVTKPGHTYAADSILSVEARPRFVSRGGEKLEGALQAFAGLEVAGRVCLDIGASTGGFTDCLLQHGAAHVIALDVGKGQLHWQLRQDERVTVIENFNARYLRPEDLAQQPQFAVVDVSFISLRLILPPLCALLPAGGEIVTLIKPQFEAGRAQTVRGVVREPAVHVQVVADIKHFGTTELPLEWRDCVQSPLLGPKGNVEFLAWWRKPR